MTGNIVVHAPGCALFRGRTYRCAIGFAGVVAAKREGDGGTPAGTWPLHRVLYRPDRETAPACVLPVSPIAPRDAWCDDPRHRDYNRPVRLPFPAGHEIMWRRDRLYDLVVVVGYNDTRPVPGAGSAIFLHLASPDYAPTAGCVAFARDDLVAILAGLDTSSLLVAAHPMP